MYTTTPCNVVLVARGQIGAVEGYRTSERGNGTATTKAKKEEKMEDAPCGPVHSAC